MGRISALTLLVIAVCGAALASVPLFTSKKAIESQYIVVFHSNITREQKSSHMNRLSSHIQIANDGSRILAVHEIGTFHGFSATLSPVLLAEQTHYTDTIAYIEQDQRVTVAADSCETQDNSVWGLDRISERSLFIDSVYHYPSSSGAGVDAYIIDTGIYVDHDEFAGRASWGVNYADETDDDCNGHGTHCAGTVGGTLYGVAKSVSLIAVKVLDCSGSGTYTGVIQGMQWVGEKAKASGRPSLASMSLGGGKSDAVNEALDAVVSDAKVPFLVAAGNENADACDRSPASASSAVAVGATTIADRGTVETDTRASFSNYGSCVALLAPGQLIKSAWIGSKDATNTISGTSMATPHVAGVTALYLAANPGVAPDAVKKFLTSEATKDAIDLACSSSACRSTPNLLLYSPCA